MPKEKAMKTVLVRHDAELEVTTKCSMPFHTKPCNKTIIVAPTLDAHMAIQAYMHGKVSGMDSGVRVKCTYRLVNPDRDILKDGQLCPCDKCHFESEAV